MPIDYNEFAEKIKAKYPQYKDVDNYTLASKMVEKYPEYKGQVDLKKKDLTVSGLGTSSLDRLTTTTTKATVSSSSRRWDDVTVEPISKPKYRTDDYIDQVQNAQKQPKQTKTVVANTFVPNAKEETVDVLTTDEANKMMAEDFGKKEFELYSKISDIDPNIFGEGKSSTVDYLNNKFKGSGFVFEKGAVGEGSGNSIVIKSTLNDGFGTVVNEKVVELPTERALSIGGFNEEEAKNVQKEISDFMNQAFLKKSEKEFLNKDVKDYGQLVKLAVTNPKKYGESFLNQYDTERWIDGQYIDLVIEGKSIKREQQLLEQEIKAYENSGVFNEETERMIKGRSANLQNQVTANIQKYEEMKDITARLPQAAAVYFQKKEKEGNLAGLISRSLLGGILNMEKMLITTAADVTPHIVQPAMFPSVMIPEVQQISLKAAGMTDAQIKDYAAKQLRKGVVKDALKAIDDLFSFGTTEEYVQSGDRNDLEKVAGFLAESIGTAFSAGGSPILKSLAFFSQSYNAIEEEMNSPEFDGLTQMEKKLMSVPYGLVIGQLDKLGFNISKNFAKSPLFNKLVTNTIARAFTSVPKDASIDVMQKAIEESLTATMARAGLNIVGGSLVEGTTEGTQSLAEYTMKNIYNNVVADKDVFQNVPDITTKEGFKKAVSAAGEEFYYGALGGAIMGVGGTAIESLTKGFNKGEKEFDFFEKVINDPNLRALIETDIKTKITSGELTKAEAKEQIDAINKSVSILNKMPENLPSESKMQAYNLILERSKIEKEIAGKDPALVAAQTERVSAINDELKQLSYAVQEQATSEVSVQPGAEVGGEMAQGKPETGSQEVTQEGEKVNELQTVRDRILKIEEAKKRGELLEDSKPGELKSLKQRESELVQKVEERQSLIDAYVQEQTEFINGVTVINQEEKQELIDELVSDPNAYAEKRAGISGIDGENPHTDLLNSLQRQPATQEAAVVEETPKTTTKEKIVDLPPTQNVGVLITPATVRNFSEETGRLKELSLEYDTLVKEYSDTKNPDTWAKVKQIESEILDNAQKQIEADVAKMPGVEVEFGKPRMGLWDGKFEPSFNMNLKVSEGSDTTATSEMLINFAEKYSQDAFILETDSDLDTEVSNSNIDVPYTEFDGDGMMHYPQISYTFANNLSDQQIADLSNKLQDSGITAFSLNDQELKISVITFLEDNLSEDEQFTRKEQEFRDKLDNSADAIENILGDNGVYEQEVAIKRSSYQGAKNEGSSDQTRQYDRGDVLKSISKKEQSVADLAKKLSKGRILQADTKDATNLQKALDALDKIEKDLDQFGKETLGVNIPVALAKTIVKAVKALVKAGVTLEQAIKQIAAEYNLSDRDVKSLLTPTKVSEIDVNEVRAKARPGKRISKGLSVKTVDRKKVIEETEDLSIEYVKKNAPKAFVSNANIIAKYPLIAGKKKFKTATTVEQAQEIYDVFVREVADNLNYLMAEFKPEYREISTLWYDGANAIANDFAAQFGVSAEQAAGIIAAMSPQKDWYQNVRLAEMVLMAYKDNPVMTKEMVDYQKGVNEKGLYSGAKSAGKKLKLAQKEYSESRTKANKEAIEEAKVKLQEAIEKADAVITMLNKYIGKNLNDVPAAVQPYMVRTYHEVNTTKDYNIVAPDGSVQGVAKKNNGAKAKVAWGSYSEIGKAVAIKNDGSQENITRSLGEMHKIRNFYNNIIDPMSNDGDVTMDTHAIAAALLLPLSGKSTQVGQNFGTKTANSAPLGIKGLYYAYADAYALAAKEAGLLPRQVQSITWEAVRGLYTDTFKGNKAEVAKINNIWKDYQDGKITIDEAREQAKESAGGIKDPTWAGPVQTEPGDGAGAQGVEGRGDGNERDTVGGPDGGGILTADTKDKTNLKKALDVLNKADDDLAKFGRETLGINIPVATMRAIIKLAKVLVKTGITLQDAIIQAAEQKNVSKKDALNAIKFMTETIKQPVKKVVVNEMAALKSQIRLEAKAAREAKGNLNSKRKSLAAAITGMVRQGKITAVQARSIINKVSRVNLDNPVMVDRLISYAERVFDRADYQETLSKAAKIRKSIKKAMKSKDLQAEVAGMAKKFSSVDPFMVEDIDQYIENAEKVLNAVRPVRETAVPLRQAADIEAISEYTTAQFERQEANKKAELLALNKYLVEAGIVTDDMTAKEIQEMIDIIAAEEYEVENADKKLNFLKNRFDFMSGVIKEMIVNNRDIFTDEALDLTQSQKDLMREVLKFDIDKLSVKQAAQVLEAMDNFINNGITSGLEAVVKGYIGNENANKLAASGLKSRPIKMYWNKAVGRFFGEQFVSLPLLVERMFPGMKKGLKVMSDIGLTDLIKGTAKADREHKMIVKDYVSQDFYKSKGFRKAENVYERGMIAFLSRNLAGTKTEMRNEFLRRIKMVEESINALMTGSEAERKMGEAYQKVYDKLKVDSQDLDVIKANAEQMNIDAVDWMTQQWAEKYSDLSDISLSVYNAILGSDTNYTPDRYKGLDESDIELDQNLLQKGSAFMGGLEYTDKNKSGVLIETTRPKALPEGRFVSLDFDVNNFSSLKGAMIDIETAPAIRQVDGFIKSGGYKRIINGDDRKILTRRINKYIIDVKGKNAFNRDTMKSVERVANFLGSLGVGKALGGLDQTVKQTAPVIINTLINAGRFDGLDLQMNAAINRSGMPIANRGIEAIAGIESIDSLIDKKGATAAEIAKAVEKVSQMYMKALLSKPDVWVARSSFISYYKNYLKTNGMSTDIDWQTHEWNQEAMNYAQMMVDRQQNISDEKLAGSFMNSSDPWKSVTRKVILPFATFIINQKNRMHNDLVSLFASETSSEDKKMAAKSLVGLSAEMLAYQSIAYFLKIMVYDQIAAYITNLFKSEGEDDEEEKKERSFFGIKMTKKQWSGTKFPVKSLISDVVSPFPLLDDAVVFGFDELMSNFPMISDEDIKKAIQDQNDARALKGQDPMDAEQKANLIKNLKDKNTYKVTFQKESLGRQYGVPGIAFDTYTELADMAQLAYTGEFEDDMGFGPKKKYISKKDQELVKWTLLPMVLYSTGLVPKDAGVVSRKVVATVKKRSISETKFNNTNELKTELGRKPKEWEESLVMNTTKKVPTIVEAIKFAERFGGLTESQGKEYAKLIEVTGDYGYLDLKRIQDGETADQILKK